MRAGGDNTESHTTLTEIIPLKRAERPTDNVQQSKGKSPTPIINSWWVRGNSALLPPSSISSLIINIISFGMEKVLNLIFNRIERLLWFRHLLWTLRRNDNVVEFFQYDHEAGEVVRDESFDHINEATIQWLHKHRNDYKNVTNTSNETEAKDELS